MLITYVKLGGFILFLPLSCPRVGAQHPTYISIGTLIGSRTQTIRFLRPHPLPVGIWGYINNWLLVMLKNINPKTVRHSCLCLLSSFKGSGLDPVLLSIQTFVQRFLLTTRLSVGDTTYGISFYFLNVHFLSQYTLLNVHFLRGDLGVYVPAGELNLTLYFLVVFFPRTRSAQ